MTRSSIIEALSGELGQLRDENERLRRVAVAAQALLAEYDAGNMECVIAAEGALRTSLGLLEGTP